ncbi:MAG: GAD domain-containing protein [Deltaproteobacteria bacterium]
MSVHGILSGAKQIIYSDLVSITLPRSKSRIVRNNGDQVHCALYRGIKGLFRKDVGETRAFGRGICDKVAAAMNNRGFFTSDELPNYGISESERDAIVNRLAADPEEDLILIFAYGGEEARASLRLCEDLIREAKYTWIYSP